MNELTDTGFTDDYGNPIYIDSATGIIVDGQVYGAEYAGVQPSPAILDPQYQDYTTGAGTSYVTQKGKPIAVYVPSAPESVSSGSGIDITKLVVDAAGAYWRYQQRVTPGTNQIYYARTAVAGRPGGGISPMIWAAIAALAIVAIS